MQEFMLARPPHGGEDTVTTTLEGVSLLESPLVNKGTAFPEDERESFGLDGLLPPHVTDIAEQLERTYHEFSYKPTEMEKHIYLRALQDRNEVLFYRLLLDHIEEMMPLVYTPTVGAACRHFSNIYRRPRGLFVPYPQRDQVARILQNRPYRRVDVIVVTDGERILGLGDQGAGGMGIPIGKLSLYTLCGGIHPARTLPVLLDAGTDNPALLSDPHYLGWRHQRIRGQEYLDFVDQFVTAVKTEFPGTLLQFEDFARDNASLLLETYRDELCTFNDDIQGTAAVTVAAVLSAMNKTGGDLLDQKVVFLGAGSAAVGIASQLADAFVSHGMPESEATDRIWMVNSRGLIHDRMDGIKPYQARFCRDHAELTEWQQGPDGHIGLLEVVRRAKPSALVGVSGQASAFSEEVVRELASHSARPIVFPLSNPTSQCEAVPSDILRWTDGRAIVSTGSPFSPVHLDGKTYQVSQCNNSYVFPGVGLGVVSSRATRVTQGMFMEASRVLAKAAADQAGSQVLPPLTRIREVSAQIALAVAAQACREGVAPPQDFSTLEQRVRSNQWYPAYPRLIRA